MGRLFLVTRAKRVSNGYILKKKSVRVCVCVCVCSTNLGFSVTSANGIQPNHGIPLPAYIHIGFENTHTHIATAASETVGVAAVSWIESWVESCV